MTTNYDPDEDDLEELGRNESFEHEMAERSDHDNQVDLDLDEDTSPSPDLHQSERDNLDYEAYSQPTIRLSPSLPFGMPPPPPGWYYWGLDKLDHVSPTLTNDIMAGCDLQNVWFNKAPEGYHQYYGASNGPWALRIGSDIYNLNVITDYHRP
jgi:hypothetical protein